MKKLENVYENFKHEIHADKSRENFKVKHWNIFFIIPNTLYLQKFLQKIAKFNSTV